MIKHFTRKRVLLRKETVPMTPTHRKKNHYSCIFAWLSVLAFMLIIFLLSAQPSTESAALSGQFLATLNKIFSADITDFIVRKAAHTGEYFLLAILTFFAVWLTWHRARPFWAFLIASLYAVSDEIHQHFIPGRACQLRDVLIDSTGAIAGILFCMAAAAIFRHLKKRKANHSVASL